MNQYLCKAEEWDDGEWIFEDSMFNAAEVYAKKWEGEPESGHDLYKHEILIEITEESGQKWVIPVQVKPVYTYDAGIRRKVE